MAQDIESSVMTFLMFGFFVSNLVNALIIRLVSDEFLCFSGNDSVAYWE